MSSVWVGLSTAVLMNVTGSPVPTENCKDMTVDIDQTSEVTSDRPVLDEGIELIRMLDFSSPPTFLSGVFCAVKKT